jgi:fumarylacetoacetate (FAA) hydrolase
VVVRLCMFHPNETPMDRGWVGRVDGERMIHLAAQTLQSLFLNGGSAREHAEYPLADVTVLAPVQYPPTVRMFSGDGSFRFANATAVVGDGVAVEGSVPLRAQARLAVVIGANGAVGGTTALLGWQDPAAEPEVKRSDFGLVLGPLVVTPDEIEPSQVVGRLRAGGREETGRPDEFSWPSAVGLAGRRTTLRPGDVLAGPPFLVLDDVRSDAELEVEGVGTLRCPVG